jgi:hypothetical protein
MGRLEEEVCKPPLVRFLKKHRYLWGVAVAGILQVVESCN